MTAWQNVLLNCTDFQHLCSSQEEAATRISLHSLDATRRGTKELYIQSPDTSVFVLAIHCSHRFCRDTYFLTGVENRKRLTALGPVVHTLCTAKAEALPGVHAFPEADRTGRFAGRRKLTAGKQQADVLWGWHLPLLPWKPLGSWELRLKVLFRQLFVISMDLASLS